jgi:hypothetical protein
MQSIIPSQQVSRTIVVDGEHGPGAKAVVSAIAEFGLLAWRRLDARQQDWKAQTSAIATGRLQYFVVAAGYGDSSHLDRHAA